MSQVKEELQVFGWWTNADIDIHCVCGKYVQFSPEITENGIVEACDTCGQKWRAALKVYPIDNNGQRIMWEDIVKGD